MPRAPYFADRAYCAARGCADLFHARADMHARYGDHRRARAARTLAVEYGAEASTRATALRGEPVPPSSFGGSHLDPITSAERDHTVTLTREYDGMLATTLTRCASKRAADRVAAYFRRYYAFATVTVRPSNPSDPY